MLSDAMEDYLKTVYVLQVETGPPVATSAIAESLDVTAPTVSSMVADLEQRGLLDREKYEGVELTDEGETVALEVLRHHRLIEAYLAERLDYDWSEVHDEADRLEHHISEEFERRVASVLDDPDVDPHGDPIPGADLSRPDTRPGTRMDDLIEGDRAVVDRVHNSDDEVLDYLKNAGLTRAPHRRPRRGATRRADLSRRHAVPRSGLLRRLDTRDFYSTASWTLTCQPSRRWSPGSRAWSSVSRSPLRPAR
ncbi:DtxR family transcriptional regulator [Halobacteriales archaeon SW_7_71_33]|nr:MAG: DtxR family transcriptional regulator [Halobacteriales archaeon SW_7_71_33]